MFIRSGADHLKKDFGSFNMLWILQQEELPGTKVSTGPLEAPQSFEWSCCSGSAGGSGKTKNKTKS